MLVALLAAGLVVIAAPASDAQDRVRFGVIGDWGADTAAVTRVTDLIDSWSPSFVVTTGDNRYGRASYDAVVGKRFCRFLKDVRSGPSCTGGQSRWLRFFPSIGNHEYSDGGGIREYLDYFSLPGNERYYDVVRGPVHLFVLNSDRHEPDGVGVDSRQARWLRDRMRSSTAPFQVVVFHHAAYSSSSHGPSTWMRWPFAEWGADLVLSGHDHVYERIVRDGLTYVVNGAGGYSTYGRGPRDPGSVTFSNAGAGAMLVDATADRLDVRFVAVDGRFSDRFTIRRAETQPPSTSSPSTTSPTSAGACPTRTVHAESGSMSGSMDRQSRAGVVGAGTPASALNRWSAGSSHRVDLCLQVPSAGRYRLAARAWAPDASSDSLFVRVAGREQVWNLARGAGWRSSYLVAGRRPVVLDLPAGRLDLSLHVREAGVVVDWVRLLPA